MKGSLVSWRHLPEEMKHLEDERREELETLDPLVAKRQADRLTKGRESGRLEVMIWSSDGIHAKGFVAWERFPGMGRRIEFLFLEPASRGDGAFARFFDRIEKENYASGPVFALGDHHLGVPLSEQGRVLLPRGFAHLDHEWMVLHPATALPLDSPTVPQGVRHPTPTDIPRLTELYVHAYRDDPMQLLWPHANLRDDADTYVRGVFSGDIQPIATDFSFLSENEKVIQGAVLLTVDPEEGIIVGNLMVDPSVRRQGVGRALMMRAITAVRQSDPALAIRLSVEVQNQPAYKLYRSLGFEPTSPLPGQRAGAWLRQASVEQVMRVQQRKSP